MSKITTFLIVLVLIARGAIYIYDNNKDKIQNLVTPANKSFVDTTSNANPPTSPAEENNKMKVSYTTLTFLLTGDKEIYYYTGPFNGTLNTIDRDYAGAFIKAYKNNLDPDDLMFLIKSDKTASFNSVIDLLDEMTKNEVPAGHYAEAEITQEELDKIKLIKKTKNG